MTLSEQRLQNGWFTPVLGLAVITFMVAIAMTPYGQLRFTYDSYDILGASESLDTYLSGKNHDGHSYLVRAPFHPFVLSFFENKVVAFWWINFLSLLGSLVLVFAICRENKFPVNVSVLVVVVNAMFIPWLLNFQFAWTEPLFIALSLLLCYVLQRDGSLLSVLSICVLLFLVRKSGLFFFAGVAVFYLTEKKVFSAVIISLSAVMIFAALQWVEFRYASSGFLPDWLPKLGSYSRIHYLDAVTSWVLPLRLPILFRASMVIVLLFAVLYFSWTKIFLVSRQRQNVLLLSLALTYAAILIFFRGVSEYEDAERYLTVLFPFWIAFGASVVLALVTVSSKRVQILIFAVCGLWFLYIFLRMVHYLFWSLV